MLIKKCKISLQYHKLNGLFVDASQCSSSHTTALKCAQYARTLHSTVYAPNLNTIWGSFDKQMSAWREGTGRPQSGADFMEM